MHDILFPCTYWISCHLKVQAGTSYFADIQTLWCAFLRTGSQNMSWQAGECCHFYCNRNNSVRKNNSDPSKKKKKELTTPSQWHHRYLMWKKRGFIMVLFILSQKWIGLFSVKFWLNAGMYNRPEKKKIPVKSSTNFQVQISSSNSFSC